MRDEKEEAAAISGNYEMAHPYGRNWSYSKN